MGNYAGVTVSAAKPLKQKHEPNRSSSSPNSSTEPPQDTTPTEYTPTDGSNTTNQSFTPWNGQSLPAPLAQSQNSVVKYVSPTGSDSNDGSSNFPWKTLQYAFSRVSLADNGIDQIVVRDGQYDGTATSDSQHVMKVKVNGTATRPVTIRAENPGKAIIHAWLQVDASSYFRLSGFTLDGMNNTGGSGISLGNNTALNYVEISYNEIKNYRDLTASTIYRKGANGIFLGNAVQNRNVHIIGNRIHDNGTNYPYDHGLYIKNGDNIVIANNVIYNTPAGYGIQIYGDLNSSFIINNTIYGNQASGLILAGSSSTSRPDNNVIASNVFSRHKIDNTSLVACGAPLNDGVNCGKPRPSSSGYAVTECCGIGTGNILRNNRESHTERSTPWNTNATQLNNSSVTDPLFADESVLDFRLLSGSPLINGAENFGLLLDADGLARDGLPDFGAYEMR